MATINVKAEDGVTLFTIESSTSVTIGYTVENGSISSSATKYGIKLDGTNIIVPSSVTKCKIDSTEANYPVTIASPTDGMDVILLGLKATEKSLLVGGKRVKLVNGKKLKSLTFNGKTYEFSISKTYDSVLANNSWADIQEALRKGNPMNWQVGDIKPLTLTNGDTYTIKLVDLQEGRYVSTDGVKCKATFEFVELLKGITKAMNSSKKTYEGVTSYTAGGWSNSDMRNYIKSDVVSLIPDELANVMLLNKVGSASYGGSDKDDTEKGGKVIYSDGDKLFLATQSEIIPDSYDYDTMITAYPQFDYYKIHDTIDARIKNQLGNTSGKYYWNRSFDYNSPDDFCYIDGDGSGNTTPAYDTNSVALCFTL